MTSDNEAHWLVYSREHNAWWRANNCGYTAVIGEAGRYTAAQAQWACENHDVAVVRHPPEEMCIAPEAYDDLRQQLTAAIERAEKAEKFAKDMVEKAADKSLDGYRELGQRLADAELRAENAERELFDFIDGDAQIDTCACRFEEHTRKLLHECATHYAQRATKEKVESELAELRKAVQECKEQLDEGFNAHLIAYDMQATNFVHAQLTALLQTTKEPSSE